MIAARIYICLQLLQIFVPHFNDTTRFYRSTKINEFHTFISQFCSGLKRFNGDPIFVFYKITANVIDNALRMEKFPLL